MMLVTSILIHLMFGFAVSISTQDQVNQKRETVLDRIVHIEEELITDVPKVARWCDQLTLKKDRINIGECDLYVEEEGEGMPIVLLHGGPGGTHHSFHPHFSRAKRFARVIYYDQRGCGLSDYIPGEAYTVSQAVDDLESLRKALGIGKWTVLGWSYGGLLGQCYTMEYPERVAGLILMTAEPALRGELNPTRQYDFISDEEKKKLLELRFLYFSGKLTLVQLVLNAQLSGDWKRQHFYRPTMEEIVRGALYEWKHDNNFNEVMSSDARKIHLAGAFEGCPIPTLIIEGKWDLTWNTDKPRKIHENHPGSELVIFERSGHSPFEDEPERFFRVIKDFIQHLPQVSDAEITQWKKYGSTWKRNQEDPFLVSEMGQDETKAIEAFHLIRKGIEEGEPFEDVTTPIHGLLSFLSILNRKDFEGMKRIQRGGDWTEAMLEEWDERMSQIDVLRAPIPPDRPDQAQIWPVYLKDASTGKFIDTHLFGYWNGRWYRCGNMGSPADWRRHEEKIREAFISNMKK